MSHARPVERAAPPLSASRSGRPARAVDVTERGRASVLATVRRTIRERKLFEGARKVLCAVSGGSDSMGMLHVLVRLAPELGIALEVASIDHGLRPAAAAEVDLVARAAAALGLPLHTRTLRLASGGDLLARARAARYRALHEIAAEIGAERIAVGHTLDDQAETVLARLLRGSGIAGLGAIEPLRADGVARPLIDVRRAAVRAWLQRRGIPFVEDPSNEDPRFARARLRHVVLPLLVAESPQLPVHLARLADEAREIGSWIRASAATTPPSRQALGTAPRPVAIEALRRWAAAFGGREPSRAQLEALLGLVREPRAGRAEIRLGRGVVARRDGDRLVLVRTSAPRRDER
ncbi:MAG: tRNA lysidine(34) synthetase TilS [Myxococcota bacterium]|nr:tRNA lysidine(34) synthetase TilS [Myxococcota bacterium]MDW8362377.1 tRNA lysidine(34) synthetase TilS [Myxococcales bacterium]